MWQEWQVIGEIQICSFLSRVNSWAFFLLTLRLLHSDKQNKTTYHSQLFPSVWLVTLIFSPHRSIKSVRFLQCWPRTVDSWVIRAARAGEVIFIIFHFQFTRAFNNTWGVSEVSHMGCGFLHLCLVLASQFHPYKTWGKKLLMTWDSPPILSLKHPVTNYFLIKGHVDLWRMISCILVHGCSSRLLAPQSRYKKLGSSSILFWPERLLGWSKTKDHVKDPWLDMKTVQV